jgi:hemolysin activation/secretion protein
MILRNRYSTQWTVLSLGLWLASATAAAGAEAIPGPADVGRVKPQAPMPLAPEPSISLPAAPAPAMAVPKGADAIFFTLRAVKIEGVTVFSPKAMADIYQPYVGKRVALKTAWIIAEQITERYRNAGYFLSRAYVPRQRIEDGSVTIKVVEGYIGAVDVPGKASEYGIVKAYIRQLTAVRPATSAAVESFLLRLNDLPGYSFRAVLSPLTDGTQEGAAELTLIPTPKAGRGSINFDNYSSRYLGPDELTASYSTSLLPMQQTTVTGLSAVPFTRLRYGTVDHSMVIAPNVSLELSGGVTKAYPNYTLKPEDIDSTARSETVSLNYQWIRQRDENLALKGTFDREDVESDILNTPLTHDAIRALRLGATYDRADSWRGYNTASFTVSQGIDGLGSSNKSDPYLSRTGAQPGFTKADLSLSRLQGITGDWSVLAAASGQRASGILYSSEQFGYGGQAFGRAYDASAITGDKGIAGSLELRYGGWSMMQPIGLQPYTFYDIGEVWNDAIGQPKRESGSSAGFGMRFTTAWHETANLGLAFPLTRDIAAPIYGDSSKRGPRILFQIGQDF